MGRGNELERGDGAGETRFEIDFRFPAKDTFGLGDIGLTTGRIVLRQGVELEGACGAKKALDSLGKLKQSDLVGIAEVDRLALIGEQQSIQAIDEIVDVAEAARLRAVAVHRERTPVTGLRKKSGDDTTVVELHAGAVGIEDARDGGAQAVLAVVGHGHGFGKALGFVVAAAGADGVDVAPVGFFLGMLEGIAIALAGRGEQEAGIVSPGDLKEVAGGGGAGLEGFDGVIEIVLGTGKGGEMENGVKMAGKRKGLADIALDEGKAGVAGKMGEIGGTTGDEVIEADNSMAFGQETIDEMGTNEAGGTRY